MDMMMTLLQSVPMDTPMPLTGNLLISTLEFFTFSLTEYLLLQIYDETYHYATQKIKDTQM